MKLMEKRQTALLFDLDGTLLDTLDDLTNSVNATMAYFGFSLHTKVEVRRFVGNGVIKLMERALPPNASNETLEKCLTFFADYYQAHLNDCSKPYPGIVDFISECYKQEIRLAVVTNKLQAASVALVKRYFSPYIEVVVGQRFGKVTKPDPEPVNEALQKLGLQKGKDLIFYVGDSEVDIQTARNSNLLVISVDWGFKERSELLKYQPDYVVSSPEEIWPILDRFKNL